MNVIYKSTLLKKINAIHFTRALFDVKIQKVSQNFNNKLCFLLLYTNCNSIAINVYNLISNYIHFVDQKGDFKRCDKFK